MVLVPTPIRLGVRVRILTAFSYGACVVAHSANALGIPELEHGENVLLGRNARELADSVARAIAEPELRRRTSAGARATYERFFAPPAAAGPIERILERIGGRGGR